MQTTSVYIEHVIIGAEVSAWVYAIFGILNPKALQAIVYTHDSTVAVVVFVGLCYVIGLVFDRVFDWLFDVLFREPEKVMKKILKIPKGTVSYKVFKEHGKREASFYDFLMSRRRIVRGTSINIIPIGVLWSYLLCRYSDEYRNLSIAIFISGLFFGVVCFVVYFKLIYDHYEQISDLVSSGNQNSVKFRIVFWKIILRKR